MRVRELMTPQARSCTTDQRASDAARVMWDHDVGSVPVVDAEQVPIGMVTDRDICMATYTRGRAPSEIAIVEVMSREIFTCRADESLAQAERVMRERQVRRLPVVDEANRLVGILSLNDVLLARARAPIAKAAQRLFGDLTATLAAVARPRAESGNGAKSSEPSSEPYARSLRELIGGLTRRATRWSHAS